MLSVMSLVSVVSTVPMVYICSLHGILGIHIYDSVRRVPSGHGTLHYHTGGTQLPQRAPEQPHVLDNKHQQTEHHLLRPGEGTTGHNSQ